MTWRPLTLASLTLALAIPALACSSEVVETIQTGTTPSVGATARDLTASANLFAIERGEATDGRYLLSAVQQLSGGDQGTCKNATAATLASGCRLDAYGVATITANDPAHLAAGDRGAVLLIVTKAGNRSGSYACVSIDATSGKAAVAKQGRYDAGTPTAAQRCPA